MNTSIVPVYGLIYRLINVVNGKAYIGQTVQGLVSRLRSHRNSADSHKGPDTPLHRAIRKYGKHSFVIEAVCACYSKEELDLMEDLYIHKFNVLNKNIGYNLKRGGARGKLSDATKAMLSQSKRGQKRSPEQRDNIRRALRSSVAFQNRPKPSEATRSLWSKNRRGAGSRAYRKDISTEEVIRLYTQGKGTTELSILFNCTADLIRDRLRQSGVELLRKKPGLRRQDVSSTKLADLYRSGKTTVELGKQFQMTPCSVANRIKSFGVSMRPRFSTPSPILEASPSVI